ncbi:hypothetical protein Syun_005366 [Stephania yunnanensis]|uniref:Uncharacterized protein n=1 Tax=Stephania yunnanensis TaxID=152371 RepID=A0AAP0L8A7_9MAGN
MRLIRQSMWIPTVTTEEKKKTQRLGKSSQFQLLNIFPMELQRLAFFATLLLILGFCHCSDKSVEVNGLVECSECSLDNIESAEVLSGHQVLISCKVDDEQFETRGIGEVKDGKFKVALPNEIVDDNGQLREECFAQLKSISSDIACPSFDDELEASKVVTQSIENGKHILGTKGKLDLSPNVCNSAFLVHYFLKHPLIKKHYKKYHHHIPIIHKKPIFYKPIPYHKPIPKIPFHKPIPKIHVIPPQVHG